MSVLQEIKKEILDSRELCGDEKLCLIVFLCSPEMRGLTELAKLMGTTVNQAQMTVRSLRMKGYLREAEVDDGEEEIEALRKLLAREQEGRIIKADAVADASASLRMSSPTASVADVRLAEFSDRSGAGNTSSSMMESVEQERRLSALGYSLSSNDVGSSTRSIPSGEAMSSEEKGGSIGSRNRHIAAMYQQGGQGKRASSSAPGKTEEMKQESPAHKEDQVMAIMDEVISRQEASIILGFAGGDLDKVKAAYKRIQSTQIKDKVDALVKLLQSK